MRELKFRAWDRENEKMYFSNWQWFYWTPFLVLDWDGWSINKSERKFEKIECLTSYKKWFLMQWTGLRDMNDKEIYEGDIFKKDNTIWEIKWNSYTASFNMYYNYLWDEVCDTLRNFEIIWNIYENPELIN